MFLNCSFFTENNNYFLDFGKLLSYSLILLVLSNTTAVSFYFSERLNFETALALNRSLNNFDNFFFNQVEDPEIIDSQFLRINVRHVTDGAGVVVGSILITPKVLMFNPNLTDQLVEESEPDKYQVKQHRHRKIVLQI